MANRAADSHDILGTYAIVADHQEIGRTATSPDEFLSILRSRHTTLTGGRPTIAGAFKTLPNQAGRRCSYGSWMNLVERWFSALTTKKLQRSAHRNVKELAADIQAWAAAWNENPTPFVWHKTADQILERLASYCTANNRGASA